MSVFEQRKRTIQHDLRSDEPDLSPKGRPDDGVLALLELLNAHHDYMTTSSCSGRAVVYLDADKDGQGDNARGRWLMNRHTPFAEDEFSHPTLEQLQTILFGDMKIGPSHHSSSIPSRMISFKFEPLVYIISDFLLSLDPACSVPRSYCCIAPTTCCHQ
jgi:tRNA wybutosine-synthesizing protein 3